MLRGLGDASSLLWLAPCLVLAAAAVRAEPLDPELSAEAIYERVLANRFEASVQELALVSGDRSGREQPLRVQMLWRRYGDGSREASQGVLSRTLIRYLEPSDIRGTGYLVINKSPAPDDQFMYLSSVRRIRRINLRNESVIGTDLSVEDIVPRELEDATYARAPDELVDGTPCYVVEATPVPEANSQYERFLLTIEPEHFVPLRTRYFSEAGVEVKELVATRETIREVEGVWLPLETVMTHKLDESWTRLRVVQLTANPEIPKSLFTQRQLEQRRLRLPSEVAENAIRF